MIPPRWYSGMRGRPIWTPAEFGSSLILWMNLSRAATLGATLRATGTTPPVLTITGGTTPYEFYIRCPTTGGTRGTWLLDWSIDGGATLVQTGVTSAATVALGSTGWTLNIAAGTAATNNVWQATVETPGDVSGLANHPTMATAANQALYRATACNGRPCLDFETGANGRGYITPSISFGAHAIMGVVRSDSGSRMLLERRLNTDVDFLYNISPSSFIDRANVISGKNVNAGPWLDDGVVRTFARSFNGTHATHLLYRNGVLDTTTNTIASADPGTGLLNLPMSIGRPVSGTTDPFKGLYRELVVINRAATPVEVALYQNWARYDSLLP